MNPHSLPPLHNVCIAVAVSPAPWCYFHFDNHGALAQLPWPHLIPLRTVQPDVTIRLQLADLLDPTRCKRPDLEGEVELAMAFQHWLQEQPLRLQETIIQQAAPIWGDYATEKTLQFFQCLSAWGQSQWERVQQHTAAYLHENHTPLPEEIEHHFDTVMQCRLAADRLEARLARLEALAKQEAP